MGEFQLLTPFASALPWRLTSAILLLASLFSVTTALGAAPAVCRDLQQTLDGDPRTKRLLTSSLGLQWSNESDCINSYKLFGLGERQLLLTGAGEACNSCLTNISAFVVSAQGYVIHKAYPNALELGPRLDLQEAAAITTSKGPFVVIQSGSGGQGYSDSDLNVLHVTESGIVLTKASPRMMLSIESEVEDSPGRKVVGRWTMMDEGGRPKIIVNYNDDKGGAETGTAIWSFQSGEWRLISGRALE